MKAQRKLIYVAPSLNCLSRFSENLRKSLYKIENSEQPFKIVRFFLHTICHTCGAINSP